MIEPWMHDIIRRVIASQGRPCEIKPAEDEEVILERIRQWYRVPLNDEPPSPPRFPGGMGARTPEAPTPCDDEASRVHARKNRKKWRVRLHQNLGQRP
jgi:hypothetical protein